MSVEPSDARRPRPPWSAFRAALDTAGFRPSRRFGQNFLLDENTARAIVDDAALPPGAQVLEVGPGCGFLTVHLAHTGARLTAVEIDPRLARIARSFLEPYPDFHLIEGDVLAGKHRLAPEVETALEAFESDASESESEAAGSAEGAAADDPVVAASAGDWHLVSNLPYSISGPLLAILAGREHPPASMTVLVQLEVADRLVAEPASRAFGPLSIAVQSAFTGRRVRTVGPASFWPRPKVDSAVVRFERRESLDPAPVRRRRLELISKLFQRRRQGLGRVLGDLIGDRAAARALLEALEIDPLRRAETLDARDLERLDAAILERGS